MVPRTRETAKPTFVGSSARLARAAEKKPGEGWPTVRRPRVPGSRKGARQRARARRRGGVGAASQASAPRGWDEAGEGGRRGSRGGVWRWVGPRGGVRRRPKRGRSFFARDRAAEGVARGETGRKGRRRRQPSLRGGGRARPRPQPPREGHAPAAAPWGPASSGPPADWIQTPGPRDWGEQASPAPGGDPGATCGELGKEGRGWRGFALVARRAGAAAAASFKPETFPPRAGMARAAGASVHTRRRPRCGPASGRCLGQGRLSESLAGAFSGRGLPGGAPGPGWSPRCQNCCFDYSRRVRETQTVGGQALRFFPCPVLLK